MIYPLVRELAATGAPIRVPVAVTCRVLKIAKQPSCRWLKNPVSDRAWDEAQLTNAAFDVHDDEPTFGYRLIADDLADLGFVASERRVWRVCSANRLLSVIGRRKRGKNTRPGPPVHDDRVQRTFTATAPDLLWLTDITEHWTSEGRLYCCAIKDVFSNRIVGYSIADRMTADLAVAALRMAIQRRRPRGTIVHSDRGSQGGFNRSSQHLEFVEVSVGSSSAGSRSGAASETSIAGASEVPAVGGCGVLARDREGAAARGGVCGCWRGAGGRRALVPQRWRYAAVRFQRAALGSLPVLRGA